VADTDRNEKLNTMNTLAIQQALAELYEMSYKHRKQLAEMLTAFGNMQQRLAEMEQKVTLEKGMRLTGLGPSVKG
jgi:hypothetical protein